jgi:transposase-like protein
MPKPRARNPSTPAPPHRWTEDDARQALAALDRSGLDLRAFARREGLDAQRLTRWRRRLAAAPVTFEEVVAVVRSAPVSPLVDAAAAYVERERFEVVLRSGRVVRVAESFDASALRRLLAVVDEAGPC